VNHCGGKEVLQTLQDVLEDDPTHLRVTCTGELKEQGKNDTAEVQEYRRSHLFLRSET
jgi:hypothetical protein